MGSNPGGIANWKMATALNQAAAPICVCGYPRYQHKTIPVIPGANGGQETFYFLDCIFEAANCTGYSPDWVAAALGKQI